MAKEERSTFRKGIFGIDHRYEREVQPLLQTAVEAVFRDQVLQGKVAGQRVEDAVLNAHHGRRCLLLEGTGAMIER